MENIFGQMEIIISVTLNKIKDMVLEFNIITVGIELNVFGKII